MVWHSNLSADKIFPRKLFFLYCVFIGPSQSNDYTWPSIWGLTLLKIDLVSARHLKERSQVLEICSQDIRIPFKCRSDYMYFYTHTRLGKLDVVVTKISFGKLTLKYFNWTI